MAMENEQCLQPSELCDFDRRPEIRARALELISGCQSEEEMFQRIFAFVKELSYGLEDWDIAASETLAKGWGMCSGKTNLLVAMLRALDIPARYRIYHIEAEAKLWEWVMGDEETARRIGGVPNMQDHVDCEVWLGGWTACDPARDTQMERGLVALGLPLERKAVTDDADGTPYLILASFDDWARERQERRAFREERSEVFAGINEHLWRVRALGADDSEREKTPPST